ncbi:hypothetical protein [Mycobacteroides abscessus]|uniref:hypothetical protein n=1 Tax=Mycobacteroides abscessus TaxID=36809 RepID=UPI0009273344|nr:hypothetical protein [Mycobacteroides abscessus]SHQ66961.1 Uncharacterised protein [Mycobacteroides abscessus subsp. abscessus]SHR24166.1 Uncharacterised protein [Mycobacteroides abscessus subsp. abscessus]SHS16764.1 Uncharacterised protein [Mycobacteroides abscessus subsp. abscessus]SHT43666.1 Uncharacterised protein [Mycobacteroides abscessus subsp. abscessus]SHT58207.1 Uncharacterised protein [Mycobacteroides abscessus subsp. abscessus]
MSARIDVSVEDARAANALATQAVTAAVHVPSAPSSVPAPGVFAPAAAAQALAAAAPHMTTATLDQYLARLVVRIGAAITAYDVMNDENRQSLTVVPE